MDINQLLKENEALKAKLQESENSKNDLQKKVEKLENLNKFYADQLKLGRAKKFGKSSEKYEDNQITFFNEAEQTASQNPFVTEPKEEELVVKKKKKKKRGANFDSLPVEVIEYKLDDTTCPECGNELHVMTKEIRKELKIIPAQVKMIEHVKYIYSCRNCENTGTKATIINATAPSALIKKSFVSPSVLSYIMNQKYVNAMPLDRQEKEFKRQGINLPKQNLSNWVIKGANLLLPLQKKLKNELVQQDILHADETTLEVLKEPGRTAECKSYMWVYRTIKSQEKQIILFDYTQGRYGKFAKEYLKDFSGYLHVDGYSGYKQLKTEGVI